MLGVIGGVGKLKLLKRREDTEVEEIVGVVLVLLSWETDIRRLFLRSADPTNVRIEVSEDGGIFVMDSGVEGKIREDTKVEEIVGVVLVLHSWETEIRRLFLQSVDPTNVRTGVSEDGGILVMGSGLEGII